MTYAEVIQWAIKDYYNALGTTSTFLEPSVVVPMIDRAVNDYWAMFQDNEFSYWRFSEKQLAVTTATDVYALPNGNPANTDHDNVAYVTKMAVVEGSYPNKRYTCLNTIFPTDKYDNRFPPQNNYYWLTNQSSTPFPNWCLEKGNLDAQGYPTTYLRFVPPPSVAFTAVYDGMRYPYKCTTVSTLTQIIDIPEHFAEGLVLRTLKRAYIRAKADTGELDKLISQNDNMHTKVQERAGQRQGSNQIKRVGPYW